MRLHMRDTDAFASGNLSERTQLRQDALFDLDVCQRHDPSAKVHTVRVRRMRTNGDAVAAAGDHSFVHRRRIPGVDTARDVNRREEGDQVGVTADLLANVAIQIDPMCTIPGHACNFSLIAVSPRQGSSSNS